MEGGADIQKSVTIITESEVESAAEEQVAVAEQQVTEADVLLAEKQAAELEQITEAEALLAKQQAAELKQEEELKIKEELRVAQLNAELERVAKAKVQRIVEQQVLEAAAKAAELEQEQAAEDITIITGPEVPKKSKYIIYIFETNIPIIPGQIAKEYKKKKIMTHHKQGIVRIDSISNSLDCSFDGKITICDKFINTSINNLFNKYIKEIIIEKERDFKKFDGIKFTYPRTTFIEIIKRMKLIKENFIIRFIKNYLSDDLEHSKHGAFLKAFIQNIYSWLIDQIELTYNKAKDLLQTQFNIIELSLDKAIQDKNTNVLINENDIRTFLSTSITDMDKYNFLLKYLFVFSINLYNLLKTSFS